MNVNASFWITLSRRFSTFSITDEIKLPYFFVQKTELRFTYQGTPGVSCINEAFLVMQLVLQCLAVHLRIIVKLAKTIQVTGMKRISEICRIAPGVWKATMRAGNLASSNERFKRVSFWSRIHSRVNCAGKAVGGGHNITQGKAYFQEN